MNTTLKGFFLLCSLVLVAGAGIIFVNYHRSCVRAREGGWHRDSVSEWNTIFTNAGFERVGEYTWRPGATTQTNAVTANQTNGAKPSPPEK